MPYDITLLTEGRVLTVRAFGIGSVEEGHRALQNVRSHDGFRPSCALLIDCRDLTYTPSMADVRRFARTYAREFPGHPIAFLTRPGLMFGLARATEELAVLHGARIMTFQEQDEAVDWLRAAAVSQCGGMD